MGQAKRKLLEAPQPVTLDFGKVDVDLNDTDRTLLSRRTDGTTDETLAEPRFIAFALDQIVTAAYPQGMNRHDARLWAPWEDVLDKLREGVLTHRVTMAQVEWLRKHVANDDLRVLKGIVLVREEVAGYLESVRPVEQNGPSE